VIRAHQPGSEPIDIPETIPNPVVLPKPTPNPREPRTLTSQTNLAQRAPSGARWTFNANSAPTKGQRPLVGALSWPETPATSRIGGDSSCAITAPSQLQ